MQVASIYTHGLQQQDKQLRATNSHRVINIRTILIKFWPQANASAVRPVLVCASIAAPASSSSFTTLQQPRQRVLTAGLLYLPVSAQRCAVQRASVSRICHIPTVSHGTSSSQMRQAATTEAFKGYKMRMG